MTTRTFATWVQPTVDELEEGKQQAVRTAQQLLPEHWNLPSPLEGWAYKDLLAHLATGDWVFQWMLRGVLGQEKFDLIERGFQYVDEGNAQRVGERKERSVEELIAEVQAEGEETLDLLAQLPEELDRTQVVGRMRDGTPVTVEMWMQGFPRHDAGHGAQLKKALDQTMM